MSETYPVPPALAAKAHIDRETYRRLYGQPAANPEAFRRDRAGFIDWLRPFTRLKETGFDPAGVRIQ